MMYHRPMDTLLARLSPRLGEDQFTAGRSGEALAIGESLRRQDVGDPGAAGAITAPFDAG